MSKFNERLASLAVVDWKAPAITPGMPPSLSAVVAARLVACNGKNVGLLDGVSSEHLLQGVESTRLLCALNDHLEAMVLASHEKNPALLSELFGDLLGAALDATTAHIESSFDRVERAMDEHEVLVHQEKVTH